MTPEKQETVLHTLNALAKNPSLTQRALAKEMQIALGAANAHMQYCIRSGFIRKSILGRTGYQLTNKGWQIRRQILADSYKEQLKFSQDLCTHYINAIIALRNRGFKSFIIQGTTEISNIAYLAAQSLNVAVDAFLSNDNKESHLGIPLVKSADALLPQQAVLFTELEEAQESFIELSKQAGRRRIAVPAYLEDLISMKEITL